jgi:hypothetical protein
MPVMGEGLTARPLWSRTMPALVIAAGAAVSLHVARGAERLCPAVVPPQLIALEQRRATS